MFSRGMSAPLGEILDMVWSGVRRAVGAGITFHQAGTRGRERKRILQGDATAICLYNMFLCE